MPEVGDPIPDVTLTSASGPVRVRDLIGQRALVLYFYPKDETPGCTAQAVDTAAKKAMEAAELAREATAAMESLKQFNEPGAETEEKETVSADKK